MYELCCRQLVNLRGFCQTRISTFYSSHFELDLTVRVLFVFSSKFLNVPLRITKNFTDLLTF